MIPRLCTPASAISLLLCVAMMAVWVRSYWGADAIAFTTGKDDDALCFLNQRGRVVLVSMFGNVPGYRVEAPSKAWYFYHPQFDISAWQGQYPPEHDWQLAGLRYRSGIVDQLKWRELHVPHWIPLLAVVALPAFGVARWRRRRRTEYRMRHTLCPACGYDLRASKDRCPECGTPITSNAGANA